MRFKYLNILLWSEIYKNGVLTRNIGGAKN